jgi:hypothetical protein
MNESWQTITFDRGRLAGWYSRPPRRHPVMARACRIRATTGLHEASLWLDDVQADCAGHVGHLAAADRAQPAGHRRRRVGRRTVRQWRWRFRSTLVPRSPRRHCTGMRRAATRPAPAPGSPAGVPPAGSPATRLTLLGDDQLQQRQGVQVDHRSSERSSRRISPSAVSGRPPAHPRPTPGPPSAEWRKSAPARAVQAPTCVTRRKASEGSAGGSSGWEQRCGR